MTTAAFILIAAITIMAISLAGVVTLHATIGRTVDTKLQYLVSFAAGVLFLSAVYLFIEAVHILGSLWYTIPLVVIGYVAVSLVDYLWPQFHHHHDSHCDINHTSGRRVLVGDGIHNIADGLVLVPAFIASPLVGVGVAVSILAHESVQEVSEFFVLKKAGYSTMQALGLNLLVSSSILVGVVIGLLLSSTTLLQGILLALSAGYFINIVLHDLLPHQHTELSRSNTPIHLGMIIIGMFLIGGINSLFAHSHDHADERANDAEHAHDEDTDEHVHEQHQEDEHPQVHDEHTDEHTDKEHKADHLNYTNTQDHQDDYTDEHTESIAQ